MPHRQQPLRLRSVYVLGHTHFAANELMWLCIVYHIPSQEKPGGRYCTNSWLSLSQTQQRPSHSTPTGPLSSNRAS